MLRKIILSLLLVGLSVSLGFSQVRQNDQRSTETKIADILMLLPAKSSADFNRLMSELITVGDIIPTMSNGLKEPGSGDDSQTRHAIAGMATYAGKTKNSECKGVAEGLGKAIGQAKSDEIRDFLLIQLQYVAGDESVATVAQYLNNDRLCDAAARVLVNINSDASKKALFAALPSAKGENQQTIVQSLAYVKYAPALDAITPLATNSDVKLRKVALFALANIASPASEPALKAAVEKVNYNYEQSDALGSYLLLLNNLLENGDKLAVENASNQMLKQPNLPVHAKGSALKLYTQSANDKNAIAEVIKALNSDDKQYREAALMYSSDIKSVEMYKALMKKASKEKRPEVKAEIITAFAVRGDKQALAFIEKSIGDKNNKVVAASLMAMAALDGENGGSSILKGLSVSNDKSIVNAGKAALLTVDSPQLISEIGKAIPAATPRAKIALLEILGKRLATDQADVVFANVSDECDLKLYVKTADTSQTVTKEDVGHVAVQMLKYVVTGKDIDRIAALMNALPEMCPGATAPLQQALYAAIKGIGSQDEQAKSVIDLMNNSQNKPAYYNVLAMIGGKEALVVVSNAFETGDTKTKLTAFNALTNWSDFSAAEELYQISKTNSGEYFDKALMAYVSNVSRSNKPADQKLLLLRRALDISKTTTQKTAIIRQVGRTGTFLAMVTAGRYLDDADVQQTAAQMVINIALAHKDYYGKVVTDLLNKAIAVNKDPEAEYQKQAVLKHMSGLANDDGWISMFNGKDLTGWKGLVQNPIARAKMTPKQLADKQKAGDDIMRRDWRVENGVLVFDGPGYDNLCSEKNYGDIEMIVDWRIEAKGDAGIYLRGSPQVQVWDISLTEVGAQVGSGGLYNNQKNQRNPLVVADNAIEEWNTFRIRMVGDKVTVYLNGVLVTDNVTLENYWDRKIPIFPSDAIELQAHGTRVEYRDIYVHEIPRNEPYEVSSKEKAEGFTPMFNGIDMSGWVGNLQGYFAENSEIICDPKRGGKRSGGNLYTENEYSDFVMRFEFQLTAAANNGLGIRTPMDSDAAYAGMELQILDNYADVYKNLKIHQYHGSIYGVIAAKRVHQKPLGEWNVQEVYVKGNHIKVTLNGEVILDGDIAKASNNFTKTIDGLNHPGLSNKKGHIGFLGHGSYVKFRNLRIKDLTLSPKK